MGLMFSPLPYRKAKRIEKLLGDLLSEHDFDEIIDEWVKQIFNYANLEDPIKKRFYRNISLVLDRSYIEEFCRKYLIRYLDSDENVNSLDLEFEGGQDQPGDIEPFDDTPDPYREEFDDAYYNFDNMLMIPDLDYPQELLDVLDDFGKEPEEPPPSSEPEEPPTPSPPGDYPLPPSDVAYA